MKTRVPGIVFAFLIVCIMAVSLTIGMRHPAKAQQGINVSGQSYSDYSSTITTGGTSQQAVGLQPNRRSIYIINLSSDILWVNFTSAAASATAGSIPLQQYAVFSKDNPADVTPEAIYVVAATTGDKYTCKTN